MTGPPTGFRIPSHPPTYVTDETPGDLTLPGGLWLRWQRLCPSRLDSIGCPAENGYMTSTARTSIFTLRAQAEAGRHSPHCLCEDLCEPASIERERAAREQARWDREERLSHRAQHPLIWI
jgi:hypothetical protein